MNNDTTTDRLTSKKKAREFWSDIVYRHGFERVDTLLGLTKKRFPEMPDGSDILETEPEDYSYANFVERVREDKLRTMSVNCYNRIEFANIVEPRLPWVKINKVFTDIRKKGLKEETILLIVFILKPFPLEREIQKGMPELHKIEKEICGASNQRIKRLPTIIKQLEKMSEKSHMPLYNTADFAQALKNLREELEYHREIVRIGKDLHKRYLAILGIDKDVKKIHPKKHKFWSVAVSTAVTVLNDFCHSELCEQDAKGIWLCYKTHKKTLQKIAELLRILYPTIWKLDVNSIFRLIEQRDYRNI